MSKRRPAGSATIPNRSVLVNLVTVTRVACASQAEAVTPGGLPSAGK
jgi:hypothetical protein